ncbi:hypothetical protein, partial [Streptococcus pneumoniae]|uniref:hypothetical protein n=1 Tax=Streptococcus pneumoniae TaxID=1313 RepID=UPI001C5C9F3E
DFYRSEHQKRKDEFCPFSSLADFNPLQLTKSLKLKLFLFYRKIKAIATIQLTTEITIPKILRIFSIL